MIERAEFPVQRNSTFSGDAANSYNDGPPAPGAKPLGPFSMA